MDYMPLGDLRHYIEKSWDEEDTRIVIQQVLLALKFLHHHQIAHRDIKPSVSPVPYLKSWSA